MNNSKASIYLKINYLVDVVSKEIKKLDKFCVGIKDNVDVLIGAK